MQRLLRALLFALIISSGSCFFIVRVFLLILRFEVFFAEPIPDCLVNYIIPEGQIRSLLEKIFRNLNLPVFS